jgi:hypothetical protein
MSRFTKVIRRYAQLDLDDHITYCGRKVVFPAPANADNAALEIQALGAGPQESYRCRDHWHLTKTAATHQDSRIMSLIQALVRSAQAADGIGKVSRESLFCAMDWTGLEHTAAKRRLRDNLAALEKHGAIRRSGEWVYVLDRAYLASKLALLKADPTCAKAPAE